MKCRLGLSLQPGQRVHVERLLSKQPAESRAIVRVIERECDAATHQGNGADAIPEPRDVEQWRDVAHAVGSSQNKLRRCAVQRQFRRWYFARAELVFQTID